MAVIRHRYAGLDRTGPINRFVLSYKDILEVQYLYTILREWLIENDFAPREDEGFPEKFYLQRENPKFGKEVWIRWRLHKDLEPINLKLWRMDLDVDIHILGWKETELIVKNKKVKADKCEIEFTVEPALIFDSGKYLEKHPFLRKYKKIIQTKMARKEFNKNKVYVFMESSRFQNALKEYLNVQKYSSDKEWAEFWKKAKPE